MATPPTSPSPPPASSRKLPAIVSCSTSTANILNTVSRSTKATRPNCTLNAFASMGLVRSIAALFSRFNSSPSPSTEYAAHALGRQGEDLAAKHLRRSRFKVLYRNFRAPGGGEVDLVCRDLDTDELVFAEVKTRQTREFGDPSEAVNREKQDLIARGAIAWLRMLDFPEIRYRFDIVEVVVADSKPEVSIIKNAFTLPE